MLSLCDFSGVFVQPWLDAGYECWIVDRRHPPGTHREGNLVKVGASIITWLPPRRDYVFVAAFPPCTHLAVSGALHFRDKKLASLATSLHTVDRCRQIAEWAEAPYFIENPVSMLSTYWRCPDYFFDPCDYALDESEAYSKRTCLWVGNGFKMPSKEGRKPPESGSWALKFSPSEDRGNLRSVTPKGFAQAIYEANRPS